MSTKKTEYHEWDKPDLPSPSVAIELDNLFDQIDSDAWGRGTLSERPTAGTSGRLYLATDTKEHFYDDGTSWVDVTPSKFTLSDSGTELLSTTPTDINFGTALSLSDDADGTGTIDVSGVSTSELSFDTATQAELDTHAGLSGVHHARYTDEEAEDTIGAMVGSQFSYDDTTPSLTLLQGSGSGLNADLLDGEHASAFADEGHLHDSRYILESGDTMGGALTLSDGSQAASRSWVNSNTSSFSGSHDDLTNVSSADHHAKYTNTEAQDSVGTILGSQFVYDSTAPSISLSQGAGSGLDADKLDGNQATAFTLQTDFDNHTASTNAHHSKYTDESAQDAVASALSSSFSYDDATPSITLDQGSGSGLNADTVDGKHASDLSSISYNQVEVGAIVLTGTGTHAVTGLGFQPTHVEFSAQARVQSLNSTGKGGTSSNDYAGGSTGFARNDGGTTVQQTVHSGGNGNSINDAGWYGSDSECIAIQYRDSNGNTAGKTSAQFSSFDSDGFTLNCNSYNESLVVIYTATRTVDETNGIDNADTVDGQHASDLQDNILVASGTTTDINAQNSVNWGSATINDTAYSFDGTTITIQEAGTYEVSADADFTTSQTRTNPNLGVFKNGGRVGVMGRSGYTRNAEGHNSSSAHATAVVEANAGDTIYIEGYQGSDTGETVSPDRSQLYVKKLNR